MEELLSTASELPDVFSEKNQNKDYSITEQKSWL
jgi:hypothetical protein